jgi:hypothetical protein
MEKLLHSGERASRRHIQFILLLFLLGRVLGPVGGPGGSEFLSLVLPKGVDIRNIHLDGIQARHQGSSWV